MARPVDYLCRLEDQRIRMIDVTARAVHTSAILAMKNRRSAELRVYGTPLSTTELAALFGLEQQAVEVGLPALIRHGLLARSEDGTIFSPDIREMEERRQAARERRDALLARSSDGDGEDNPLGLSRQVRANRENGKAGGRPRKDGSPPRNARWAESNGMAGQTEILLPMQGGGQGSADAGQNGFPEKKPIGFHSVSQSVSGPISVCSSASRGLTDCLIEENQSLEPENQAVSPPSGNSAREETQNPFSKTENPFSKTHLSEAECQRVGLLVLDAAGLPRSQWGSGSAAIVRSWPLGTCSADELVAIATDTARKRPADKPIRGLPYFTQVFRQHALAKSSAERGGAAQTTKPLTEREKRAVAKHREALQRWESKRSGPLPPRLSDFIAREPEEYDKPVAC